MKKEYKTPEILVVELKQQGCLMAGSYPPAGEKRVNNINNDMDFTWDLDGFEDEEMDM